MLITLPFSVAAGFGDFSETRGRPPLRPRVFGRRVARAVAFRNVTRRKETMCLAVLRCAGAMKISTASLPRDRKINITFSETGGEEREGEGGMRC